MSRCPSATVVIVTRDRPTMLEAVLRLLREQSYAEHEVVVVDTSYAGTARPAALAMGTRYMSAPRVTLGAARQAGVRVAAGEIVAFTDDDCLPRPDWLEALVVTLRDLPDLLGVRGATVAEIGPVGAHAVRVDRPDPLYHTCNIAYRRDAVQRAGGFDSGFVRWFEDTALAARVLRLGPIGWQPRAVVMHRALPRRPLDRSGWATLLADERRLATDYPDFYRRYRGPGFVPTVVIRWLLGSPLKTLARDLARAPEDPGGYGRLALLLLRERVALLAALLTRRPGVSGQDPCAPSTFPHGG